MVGLIAFIVGAGVMHFSNRMPMDHRIGDMDMSRAGDMKSDMRDSEIGNSMGHMMASMNDSLKGKTGTELEKVFLSEMIVHHQGAVDMAKMLVADKTIKPELSTFGNAIITAQEKEISQMNEWLKAY